MDNTSDDGKELDLVAHVLLKRLEFALNMQPYKTEYATMNPHDRKQTGSRSTPQDSSTSDASKGFELDEGRPYGQDSGWARQGGQVDGKPEESDKDETEPTH